MPQRAPNTSGKKQVAHGVKNLLEEPNALPGSLSVFATKYTKIACGKLKVARMNA